MKVNNPRQIGTYKIGIYEDSNIYYSDCIDNELIVGHKGQTKFYIVNTKSKSKYIFLIEQYKKLKI